MPHPESSQDTTIDARVLHWLAHYPMQRAEDLVLGLARWCARPTVYRHLQRLEAAGLVTTVPAASSGGARLYALSLSGMRWWTQQSASDALGGEPPALLRVLPRLPVLLPLQAFLNSALLHLSRGLTHQGRQPTLVRWNWHRDYAHPFTFREQGFTLHADAAWTFGVRNWQGEAADAPTWFACFLLFQPLTEARLMLGRLDRLLRWRESAERWAHYQAMPPVLILATSRRQAEWWQFCAEKAAARLRVDPLGGAIIALEELPPRSSPWQTGWRRLVTQEHLHLRDLFAPLSLEALPLSLRPRLADPLVAPLTLPQPLTRAASRTTKRLPAFLHAHQCADVRGEHAQLAWLSGHLSARHWHLLLLLFAHPLLSREELATFLSVRASSARLLLQPLARWGCLSAHETEGGPRWYLSALGVRLLATAHQVDVRNFAVASASTVSTDETVLPDDAPTLVQRGVSWLQHHVQHTEGLYGFFTRLIETSVANQELCWWETGTTCERRYYRQDHWHNFRPDALAEYRVGTRALRFWLEWDRGTMQVRDLRAKFASYTYYLASREWVKERTPLPWLLCVTPDVGQEQRLARGARSLVESTHGLALYTTTARLLETLGPQAKIWTQVVPLAQQTESVSRVTIFTPS